MCICFIGIAWAVLISFTATTVSPLGDSPFLFEFFRRDFLTLLAALLAINITTTAYISTKLGEYSRQLGHDYSSTIAALQESITSQVILIVVSVAILIFSESTLIDPQSGLSRFRNVSY